MDDGLGGRAGQGRDGMGDRSIESCAKEKRKRKSKEFYLTDQQEMRNMNRLRSKHGRGERRWITLDGGRVFFFLVLRSPVLSNFSLVPPPSFVRFYIIHWDHTDLLQETPNSKSFLSPSIIIIYIFFGAKKKKMGTS